MKKFLLNPNELVFQSYNEIQESLVDLRFKQLAIDLQGQVDELKHKVVRLEATNNQGASKDHHQPAAGKQKRQNG